MPGMGPGLMPRDFWVEIHTPAIYRTHSAGAGPSSTIAMHHIASPLPQSSGAPVGVEERMVLGTSPAVRVCSACGEQGHRKDFSGCPAQEAGFVKRPRK